MQFCHINILYIYRTPQSVVCYVNYILSKYRMLLILFLYSLTFFFVLTHFTYNVRYEFQCFFLWTKYWWKPQRIVSHKCVPFTQAVFQFSKCSYDTLPLSLSPSLFLSLLFEREREKEKREKERKFAWKQILAATDS